MRDFAGRVAVVTGAASGIGRALACRFATLGMRVAIADVEESALAKTARLMGSAEALTVRADVSRAEDVDALAEATVARFGAVHVVCNNAGVFAGGTTWGASVADYDWVLGVNVWGVIHGIRTFVPLLLRQGEEGHVVNTASMAALTSSPYSGPYTMTKHAVLALSECLYHELRLAEAKVGVSVLCPEAVATGIGESERNRPARLHNTESAGPEAAMVEGALRDATGRGLAPSVMAERVERAIREDRFYVTAEDDWRRCCDVRLEDIRLGRNPTFAVPEAARERAK